MDPRERIILALDVSDFQEAKNLVLQFKDEIGMFKVGKQLFTSSGPRIVEFIKDQGSKVFLDLKYHDIPNTVAKASIEALKLGVDMLNVHALGGLNMMKETKKALLEFTSTSSSRMPLLIAVTVLTSIDDSELREMGIDIGATKLTENLARLAKKAGFDGVVASGEDIVKIRGLFGEDFVIVTPGVRVDSSVDDQKRVITPEEAIRRGSTYIVLGRTVLAKKDPHWELERISLSIRDAILSRQRRDN